MAKMGVKGRRRPKRLPKPIPEQDFISLLSAPSRTSILGTRARAIIALLGLEGLRVGEVCGSAGGKKHGLPGLKIDDMYMDAATPYLRVIGKSSKERRIWLDKETISILDDWLENRPSRMGNYLFPVIHKGKKGFGGIAKAGKPMSTNSVRAMVSGFAVKARIKRRVTPHMLRHTFAIRALDTGVNLKALQEMMGHAELSTTSIYLQIFAKDVIAEKLKMTRKRTDDIQS